MSKGTVPWFSVCGATYVTSKMSVTMGLVIEMFRETSVRLRNLIHGLIARPLVLLQTLPISYYFNQATVTESTQSLVIILVGMVDELE